MLHTMVAVAQQAGRIAQEHAGRLRRDEIFHKGSTDMVTRVDRELEDLIRSELARAFPAVAFHGEEGSYDPLADQPRVFVVDPLDGTTSFIHGHPFYSVSLAYREAGVTRLGVVYLPAFGETYWSVHGSGAFHDGRRLHVSDTAVLIEALAATGFACVRARLEPDGLPLFNDMIYRIRGIRRCGSAAIDLCYVGGPLRPLLGAQPEPLGHGRRRPHGPRGRRPCDRPGGRGCHGRAAPYRREQWPAP